MSDTKSAQARCAYGEVVNVRPIQTRGVTRVEIELPIEVHVALTQLLYNQKVLVMPMSMGNRPYGLVDVDLAGTEGEAADAGREESAPQGSQEPQDSQRQVSDAAASRTRHAPLARRAIGAMGLGMQRPAIDIIRWLGARCSEATFQDWLGVRNEAQAVERVRQMCGVSSRAQIPQNARARRLFETEIYAPYNAHHPDAGSPGLRCAAVVATD